MDFLRTARDGCYKLRTNAWGSFLARIDDPDANGTLPPEALKTFELRDDIAPIPADLWQRWVQLCFHFARKSDLEVACRLLRREDDKTQWRIIVPPQSVSAAHVDATYDGSIDITTGEAIHIWPPAGWIPCGSSHSHHRMTISFSSTDDKDELGDPGLHVLIRSINLQTRDYQIDASITSGNRRFLIPYSSVIQADPVDATFHPDVLTIIDSGRERIYDSAWLPKYNGSHRWQDNAGAFEAQMLRMSIHRSTSSQTHQRQADYNLYFDDAQAESDAYDPGADLNWVLGEIDDMFCRCDTIDAVDELEVSLQSALEAIATATRKFLREETLTTDNTDVLPLLPSADAIGQAAETP